MILRQSTAVDVLIGPFVDSTDGYTPEVGVSPAPKLSKAGQALAAKADATTPVHDADGYYNCGLDATDTNTIGTLVLSVVGSATSLAVRHEFQVIEEAAYDAIYASGAAIPTVTELNARTLVAAAYFDPAVDPVATVTDVTNQVTAAANADAVWDELLTGASHNIATSAGRRLRSLQDFGLYEGGAVWVDTVNGTAGTTDFENGTVNNPVDSIADAKTLADSVGLNRFKLISGSSITLAASYDSYEFTAYGSTIALGGQSVSGTIIGGAIITGNDDGSNINATHYRECEFGNSTLGLHEASFCRLKGNITLAEAGDYLWDYCSSFVAGNGTPDVTFPAGNANLNVRHYSGGMEINSMAAGDTMSFEGDGQFKIAATCSGGAVSIRGSIGPITDAAAGAVTLTENARIADDTIGDAAWDETLADHLGAGSTGNALNAAGAAGDPWSTALPGAYGAGTAGKIIGDNINAPLDTIDANVDTVAVDVAGLNGDAMRGTDSAATAAALATVDANVDAILADTGTDGVVISATTANEIADAILKRDWTAVSGEAARSALNALRFLRNKWSIAGTTLTVTEEDDSTEAWTATVSTDAAAEPVTGNDPA